MSQQHMVIAEIGINDWNDDGSHTTGRISTDYVIVRCDCGDETPCQHAQRIFDVLKPK